MSSILACRFRQAVDITQRLAVDGPLQPSVDQQYKCYGLYKQATRGACTQPFPRYVSISADPIGYGSTLIRTR